LFYKDWARKEKTIPFRRDSVPCLLSLNSQSETHITVNINQNDEKEQTYGYKGPGSPNTRNCFVDKEAVSGAIMGWIVPANTGG
jgi:hypothetical protein